MHYNVVNEYDWTSSPRGSGMRQKAPRVLVKSYKLVSNQIMSAIEGFMALGKFDKGLGLTGAKEFYDKMYGDATEAEDNFSFPFFEDTVRSFGNTFGDTFQNGVGESGGIGGTLYEYAKGLAGTAAQVYNVGDWKGVKDNYMSMTNRDNFKDAGEDLVKTLKAAGSGGVGTYIETPLFYQYEKNDNPLEIKFILSNTLNGDFYKNYELIKRLMFINRPYRKNSIAITPPRIYRVLIKGYREIRWAYCSQFSAVFQGTRRELNGIIIPEAYEVSMTMTPMVLEVGNYLQEGGDTQEANSADVQKAMDKGQTPSSTQNNKT